jgi:metal-responsive CopG/Arc/MetJ family transcriptional regulator
MAAQRQKFASQAPVDLLDEVREIAREDGRQLQAVIEDALRSYVQQRRGERPRTEVLAHLQASVAEHRELYRRLAE